MAASYTRVSLPGPTQISSDHYSEESSSYDGIEPSRPCYCRVNQIACSQLDHQKDLLAPESYLKRDFTLCLPEKELLSKSLAAFKVMAESNPYPGTEGIFAHVCGKGDWSMLESGSEKDPCRRLCFENMVDGAFITKVNINGFPDGRVSISIYTNQPKEAILSAYLRGFKISDSYTQYTTSMGIYWSTEQPVRILLYYILSTYNTFPKEWEAIIRDAATCIDCKEVTPIEPISTL